MPQDSGNGKRKIAIIYWKGKRLTRTLDESEKVGSARLPGIYGPLLVGALIIPKERIGGNI